MLIGARWPLDLATDFPGLVGGGVWAAALAEGPIRTLAFPCAGVLSTIGINKPGDIERGMKASQCDRHLWQLHVCLPTSEGKTRLLYRMGLDFWGFTKQIPLLDNFWRSVADQVAPRAFGQALPGPPG